jgi:hypothetical protein
MNYTVYRTIQYTQVNLYLTCIILVALTFANQFHVVRGFLLALGTFVKVYPALLLPAFMLDRQWKVCAWTFVWGTVLFGITLIGFGLPIYTDLGGSQAVCFSRVFSGNTEWFNIQANLFGTVCMCCQLLQRLGAPALTYAHIYLISTIFKVVLGLWFSWRAYRRHRIKDLDVSPGNSAFYDDVCDLITFGFLAGPTTLQEQYPMTIPVILWTIARCGRARPFQVMLGCILITNFQSDTLKIMPLAPLGLILLAQARAIAGKLKAPPGLPADLRPATAVRAVSEVL